MIKKFSVTLFTKKNAIEMTIEIVTAKYFYQMTNNLQIILTTVTI
jgi:hypothetical protein